MPYKDKKKQYAFQVKWKQKQKVRMVEYKGGKCSVCGYSKYMGALEFHHINPKVKDWEPAKLVNYKWKTITEELDKCILVCSNCHREIEAGFVTQLAE